MRAFTVGVFPAYAGVILGSLGAAGASVRFSRIRGGDPNA